MASPEVAPGTPDGSMNSSSLHKEGPVLCFLNKRLRALKKKYNRILQIEESKLKGKLINKEQEEVLHSKVGLASIIEEYEKLKQPLTNAVKEELAEKEREVMASGVRSRDENGSSTGIDKENNSSNGETVEKEDNLERNDVLPKECSKEIRRDSQREGRDGSLDSLAIADLLQFMYFSQLFEVKSRQEFASMMWTKIHERTSCLSYDYVTEDATDHLREEDLDALAILGSLMTARSSNATVSHKDALQSCLHHARQWLYNSDQPILEGLPLSYSSLRERLNRIISSEYFVMTPELKTFSRQSAPTETTYTAQYSPHVLIHLSSAEDGAQLEGASNCFQQHNETNSEHRHYVNEESSSPSGSGDLLNGVGDGNTSFSCSVDNQCSSESLQNENQIPASPLHDLKQGESHYEQLHSLSQLSQQNGEHDRQQHPRQSFHQRQSSRQQQQQYYAQNRGMLKSNERGGWTVGYGGVVRGKGYMNGRGNRGWRVSNYFEGNGQYYDHGNQSPRNYYGRRGRGGRTGGQMEVITMSK